MAISQAKEIRHPLKHRILHEIIMVAILLLVATGFYIHRPFVGGGGFLMSMSRGVHFFAAAVLIIATVLRVWCMFFGSTRDCRLFIPTWSDLKLLPKTINYYAYIGKEPENKKKYNPLQMLSYCLAFLLIIFQILSGFALQYNWHWFNYSLFGTPVVTRMSHFVVNWLFVIFLMIHVYLTIRESFHEIKEMHLLSENQDS